MPQVDPECPAILAAFRRRNIKSLLPSSLAARDPMYRRAGSSFDLKCIREYQPFDDPRAIDWKLLGRTDRAYVKEFYDEANEGIAFLVDASGSMAGAEGYREFISSLGFLLLGLGLSVSVWAYADGLAGPRLSLRNRGAHRRLSEALDGMETGGRTDTAKAWRQLRAASPLRRVFVFSDFHEAGFRPPPPGAGRVFLVRFRLPFSRLAQAGTELEVTDPETGSVITLPWDRVEERAWDEAETMREAGLRSGGPRSSYIRRDPGESRAPAYWEILERLPA